MALKIIVAKQEYPPNFNLSPETVFMEYKLEQAEFAGKHYAELKKQSLNSGGMMHVTINIVDTQNYPTDEQD